MRPKTTPLPTLLCFFTIWWNIELSCRDIKEESSLQIIAKTFRLQGSMTASYYRDNRTDQDFQHEDQDRRQAVPESGTKDNSALKPRKTTETTTTTSSSSSSFGWSRPGSTTPRGHSPTCVRLFFCVLRTGEIVPWTF